MTYKITTVLGTAREGNNSERVFKFINNTLAGNPEIELISVDVKDYLFGHTTKDESVISEWKNVIENSDGVIFVSPEYNHSYPGELKILIDSLYEEYSGKVAAVVGVSMGPYAGVRVSELLKTLLLTVNFDVLLRSFDVGKVQNMFNEEGNPNSDSKDKLEKHLDGLVSGIKEKVDLRK